MSCRTITEAWYIVIDHQRDCTRSVRDFHGVKAPRKGVSIRHMTLPFWTFPYSNTSYPWSCQTSAWTHGMCVCVIIISHSSSHTHIVPRNSRTHADIANAGSHFLKKKKTPCSCNRYDCIVVCCKRPQIVADVCTNAASPSQPRTYSCVDKWRQYTWVLPARAKLRSHRQIFNRHKNSSPWRTFNLYAAGLR